MLKDAVLAVGVSSPLALVLFSQGSVAIAGAVVRWLKDNLGIIQTSSELGECAPLFSPSSQMHHTILTWPRARGRN